jgi:lipopolysaccharide export system permease protein
MRIMDGYLVRQFVKAFAITFVSLTGLYIVIDAFGHLDEFVAHAERHGSLLSILTNYYAHRSLVFFDMTSGILALLSSVFTVTWLQRHQELTALLAAGIPTMRIVKPILVCALTVSVLAAATREMVIPPLRQDLDRDTDDLADEQGRDVHPQYDHEIGVFLDGKKAFGRDQRIQGPNFRLRAALSRYGDRLIAKSAYWKPADGSIPAGYLLTGVSEPKGLASQASLLLGSRPVLITPKDASWLKPDECFLASQVSFHMLYGGKAWQQYASTWELIRNLASSSVGYGAEVRVTIHSRIVQPLLDATLLFLGLPLAIVHGRRNLFAAIGLCLLLVVVFMLVVVASQYLGFQSLVRPSLAAWLPLLIFVPAAAGVFDPLRQ